MTVLIWITQLALLSAHSVSLSALQIVFSNSHSTNALLFLTQSCRNEPTMSQNFLHCHSSCNQSCGTRSGTDEVKLFQAMRNITETGTWLYKTINHKIAHESPHHAKVQVTWSWNKDDSIIAALSRIYGPVASLPATGTRRYPSTGQVAEGASEPVSTTR